MISKNNSNNKEKRAFFKYFEIIFSKASKFVLLNLAYFACIIPLLCGVIYAVCILFGAPAELIEKIFFVHLAVWVTELIPFPVFVVLFFVSLIAYGPLTAGLTYCIRNIVTDKYVWISEMFTHAKSNFKQGMIFGITDIFVLASFILYISGNFEEHTILQIARILAIVIFFVYCWIRFYSYSIAVTFELSIKDIFKNSLIFCVLGFFKNIIAVLVCAFILFTFLSTPKVDIVLLATLVFSLCRYTAVFTTYPIIEKYMLKTIKKQQETKQGIAEESEETAQAEVIAE